MILSSKENSNWRYKFGSSLTIKMAIEMLGISHLENNCKMRKEDSLGMRSEEAQHLKIRQNEITQPRILRGSGQGRRKEIRTV